MRLSREPAATDNYRQGFADGWAAAMRSSQPMRTGADPTANCPCRPENGGSGICGCIRNVKVTC